MPYESIPENSPATGPAIGSAAGTGVSHVTVGPDGGGQRIDNWLLRELKGVPRSRIYRILRKGEVRVNGKRAKPEYRVVAGDDIRLPPVRTPTEQGPARVPDRALADIESSVVFEDKDLLVIAKASGVAVHGGSGLSFGVIEALRASRPNETLELVHRLDRDTSGLLMVARNRTALRSLHGLLRDGLVEKQYLALVQGSWNLGTKTIDVPLDTRARQGGERQDPRGARGLTIRGDLRGGKAEARAHLLPGPRCAPPPPIAPLNNNNNNNNKTRKEKEKEKWNKKK